MKTYCNDDLSILKMMQRDYQQKSLREDLAREKAESYQEGQNALTNLLADELRKTLMERFDSLSMEVDSYISKASFMGLTKANQNVYFVQEQNDIIQYLKM